MAVAGGNVPPAGRLGLMNHYDLDLPTEMI